MKTLPTDRTKKTNHKVWIYSLLTAVLLVAAINVIAGPGIRGTSVVQTDPTDGNNKQLCNGNAQDACITAPSVDLYPSGREDATNPVLRNQKGDEWKSIDGVVTSVNGKEMQLRTTSDRVFTVIFPLAVQTWWNEVRGPHYGNYQMGVGDTVRVDYLEPVDQARTIINTDQIRHSVVAIDLEAKGAAVSGVATTK